MLYLNKFHGIHLPYSTNLFFWVLLMSALLANYGVLTASSGSQTIYDFGAAWNPKQACPGDANYVASATGTYGEWGIVVPTSYIGFDYYSAVGPSTISFSSYLSESDSCPNAQNKQFTVSTICGPKLPTNAPCADQYFDQNGGSLNFCCTGAGEFFNGVYYAGWNDVSGKLNAMIIAGATAITALDMANWNGVTYTADPCPGITKQFTIRWICHI